MLKRIALVLVLLALPLTAQERNTANTLKLAEGAARPKATLDAMKWLAGGWWTGNALGGLVEETWSEPAGGAMMGMFRLVKGGKVSFYELLTIVEVDGSLAIRLKHFNADLTGWEEQKVVREFGLVAIRDGVIHFDGMAFKPDGDRFTVWLAIGQKDGTVQEAVFEYRRVQSRAASSSSDIPSRTSPPTQQ